MASAVEVPTTEVIAVEEDLRSGASEMTASVEATVPLTEDAVQQILRQPREEMDIVKLLNADPLIRQLLLRNPEPELETEMDVGKDSAFELQREDSIIEEDESEEGAVGFSEQSEESVGDEKSSENVKNVVEIK